ncbi:hypothetical protein AAV97_17325 [Acinetobacter sp. Ag2]|uniref:hypothetical protein n=1 Tax=Acinetobacter sp. Ag2 TaxID=1646532 RepID=UPI00062935CA|nr:hypothetical protein [Acinetobacter sp. Ag2]KKW76152.1 hypothetical protein AAV97_17325 [Acinetobacter sp. Ag2]
MQHYIKVNNGAFESFMDYIQHVLQSAKSFGSKSSILSILAWVLAILVGALTASYLVKAPTLISVGLFALIFLIIIAILIAFFYCLFTGKTDFLRSEKFNLEKLAIEKQSSSDSLIDVHSSPKSLPNTVKVIEPVQEEQ